MPYYYHRRRKTRRNWVLGVIVVALLGVGGWYFWPRPEQSPADTANVGRESDVGEPRIAGLTPDADSATPSPPADVKLVADARVESDESEAPQPPATGAGMVSKNPPAVIAEQATESADPSAARATNNPPTDNAALQAARKLYEAGRVLEARSQLNTLLSRRLSETDATAVRALLTRIADETVLGKRSVPNDPLVTRYTVQAGDTLTTIGSKHAVPAEIIQSINGIADPRSIRVGQVLKVPRGPFHARIYKSQFRLDLYLGDVYLRSFRVGLGLNNGTPEGVWKVKNRLTNPTYYPSASESDKRIIPADDPSNPLGEYWIGLEGTAGDAVGREGYGIHGTIKPESVGKAVSRGCVRMHNEDVQVLFSMLLPGKSTVTILH